MLNSSSAGSFAGELDKWHKYFQTIEEVLEVWLEVQDLWFELEEVSLPIMIIYDNGISYFVGITFSESLQFVKYKCVILYS